MVKVKSLEELGQSVATTQTTKRVVTTVKSKEEKPITSAEELEDKIIVELDQNLKSKRERVRQKTLFLESLKPLQFWLLEALF